VLGVVVAVAMVVPLRRGGVVKFYDLFKPNECCSVATFFSELAILPIDNQMPNRTRHHTRDPVATI